MAEIPRYPPAKCMRCRHLGEATSAHLRNHYVMCCYPPLVVPAIMRLNGFYDNDYERLIPRRELVGFSDARGYETCATFEPRPDTRAVSTAEESKPELVEGDPKLFDLLAPFRPEVVS